MKLPELPTVLKMRVVLKTLAVQACLLVGILVVVWGLQRVYAMVDTTTFPDPVAVPENADQLSDNEKGKILLDAITHQLRYELNSPFGWSFNDIVFNRFVLDNRAYRQYGVYHATKFLLDLYSSQIAKLGSSDRESEFLYKARINSFAMDPRRASSCWNSTKTRWTRARASTIAAPTTCTPPLSRSRARTCWAMLWACWKTPRTCLSMSWTIASTKCRA